MRFLVFQHIPCEHPGTLKGLMVTRRIAWDTVELDAGHPIPPLDRYDALLVFGGPMNVDEETRYPWLTEELHAIRDAALRGLPYLGFCLGAQLLAKALGGVVTKAPEPEVGVTSVTLNDAAQDDVLLTRLGPKIPVFQWHGDTFTLPPGSVHLAASGVCRNQAFRYGRAAFGFQFHVEVTPAMVAEWGQVPEYRKALEALRGPGAMDWLLRATHANAKALEAVCATMFERFLDLVRSRYEATRQ